MQLFFTLSLAQCTGRTLQRPDISKALEKLNCSDTLVGADFLYNHRPSDTKLAHQDQGYYNFKPINFMCAALSYVFIAMFPYGNSLY